LWLLIEHPVKKDFIMNFKKISRRALIAFGLVASASGAMAQSSATANGTVTANVIRPITITATRALAFGNIVPSAVVGTLVLDPAGAQGTPGGATWPGSQKGTVSSAQFVVTGEASFTYTLTIPAGLAGAWPITNGTPANDMTVDTFTSDLSTAAGAGVLTPTSGGAGSQTVSVGATLHVGANQVAGAYTGSFPVTVAYN
jgi:hypothetical protein